MILYSLSAFQHISSPQEVDCWFSNLLSDSSSYTRGIFLKESNQLIGYAGICNLSHINKSGEYFIFLGDKNQWGKGIGTTVTKKIFAHGFEKLALNRIMLTVSEPNKNAIRAYQKAGFVTEGKLRQACFRDGSFHDKIIMSVLKENDKTSSIT